VTGTSINLIDAMTRRVYVDYIVIFDLTLKGSV
jgi:hypothetical protein